MKILICLLFALPAFATVTERIDVPTDDQATQLDVMIYSADDSKGVVLVVGGSGYSTAGFRIPATVAARLQSEGMTAIEWNKRGLRTNAELDHTEAKEIYFTNTFDKILEDAETILKFAIAKYSSQKIFVVGMSEGSIIASLLAEKYPKEVKAIATQGTVVTSFIEVASHMLMQQIVNPEWLQHDKDSDWRLSEDEYDRDTFGVGFPNGGWQFLQPVPFGVIDVTRDGYISMDEMIFFVNHYFLVKHPEQWLEPTGTAPGWLESVNRVPSLFSRIESIKQPYLIVHGENDANTAIAPVYQLEIMCRTLRKKNVIFRYHAGVTHTPSAEMLDQIAIFLKSKL